jgi:predicted nucleic acid-binding protein
MGSPVPLTMLLDTNVLIRHLTGDPPALARRATRFLERATGLVCPDLVVAETVYVLESFYDVARDGVAGLMRSVVASPAVIVSDELLILRAIEVYEVDQLHFAEAYLVATAERSGIDAIASFDKSIDRVPTVRRVEPR